MVRVVAVQDNSVELLAKHAHEWFGEMEEIQEASTIEIEMERDTTPRKIQGGTRCIRREE